MSLVVERLSIRFRNNPPLFAPVSMVVAPGEVGTLMGPSGVGKSTLLDAIGGHLGHGFVASGRMTLNGRPLEGLPPEARRIGLLFQDPVLFAHLSVGDNLAFGLGSHVKGRAARSAAVAAALEQADLAGMGGRDPATLSGGQKARVALMRTLLAEPLALLLDEPFSKLDSHLRKEMRDFTFSHIRKQKVPALLVTHDPDDAMAAAGPVLHLAAA
jgi:putative thiamine transport system ATP-binding protein